MHVARTFIDRPLYTWLIILGCLFGGIWGFSSLGRLEDPAFTIKTAVVVTQYPGASAEQVAEEVTEPLESSIQLMDELDYVRSVNFPGLSRFSVEVQDSFAGVDLPAIWSDLRNKVGNAARNLPSGTSEPQGDDGFGDVFGLIYAVTAPGFTDAEILELSTFLRREILTVDGVASVDLDGLPEEAVYVDVQPALAVNQAIAPQSIVGAISSYNAVQPAGAISEDLLRLPIQGPNDTDGVSAVSSLTLGVGGEGVDLSDFTEISRQPVPNPAKIIRHNGERAFTLGVAGLATENIVEIGHMVDAKLAELDSSIPYGVTITSIYEQHIVVEEASNGFLVNLSMSVAIVVVVLALAMGWRAAIVVGTTLLLTVVGTLFFMAIFSIEMERISLGALIIAMGMLVANAIVVAEGMQVAMQRGKNSRDAADEAAGKTQIPLLGATVIGIMAFAGIGLSPDSTGEFMFSLFAVIGISLLLSWVLALSVTPLLGHYVFKQGSEDAADAYSGPLFKLYGRFLGLAIRLRWITVLLLIAVTVVCYAGFGQIRQQFFPDSNTPIFFVHYKLPQGTDINTTAAEMSRVEDWLAEQDEVKAVSTFVGGGATRFILTYGAEDPNSSYGHLIVRTETLEEITALRPRLEAFAAENLVEGEFRVERLVFGPGGGAPVAARFSGPDPAVLRTLAQEAQARMIAASDNVLNVRTDWREQELVIRPVYAENRAQTAGIARDELASTLLLATDGTQAGVYREDDRLIPIIVRIDPDADLSLIDQLIYSPNAQQYIGLEQVSDGLRFEAQNTLVHRRDRLPTITGGADIPAGFTAAQVHTEVRATIEAMILPPGYLFEWGGEFENSANANESLAAQLPLSLLIMVLISVLLFNALRQPIIIWLLVPMSVNGVTIGLLGTNSPFTFTALLGLLSLSGMLIKNGIVLVEEIDLTRKANPTQPLRESITEACMSRLRPVVLAAATTILGMAPLLTDAFFRSMAITIMGGLAFASILTLVAAPVLYDLFFSRGDKKRLAALEAEPAPA
ncbi:MAG: efflux RND transporter permease subunit [Cohaesibacteraceae bacterium]